MIKHMKLTDTYKNYIDHLNVKFNIVINHSQVYHIKMHTIRTMDMHFVSYN